MKKRVQHLLKLVPLEILVIGIVFLCCLSLFSFIVYAAVNRPEDAFDKNTIHFFALHATPPLVAAMQRITFFGSSTFLLPAYLVLVAWYVSRKKFQYAIDIAVIALSSTALMFALKQVFHRHRPALPVITGVSGYSFPSGHALSSFIFFSILVYLVYKTTWPAAGKILFTIVLLLYPLAVGLSRIVLNVHYATDVIGGFCLAVVWVIIAFSLLRKIRKSNPPATTGKFGKSN